MQNAFASRHSGLIILTRYSIYSYIPPQPFSKSDDFRHQRFLLLQNISKKQLSPYHVQSTVTVIILCKLLCDMNV